MTVVIDGTTGIDTVQDGTVAPADLTTGAPSWNSAGNLSFNSGYGSAAVAYGCRAWVNFNGTGTVAIRADGGVSSITDNGTGNYTINFDVSMPDADYGINATSSRSAGVYTTFATVLVGTPPTTSACVVQTFTDGGVATDPAYVFVSIFR